MALKKDQFKVLMDIYKTIEKQDLQSRIIVLL